MGGGPKGSSSSSYFGSNSFLLQRIFASFDRVELIIEHTIRRVPDLPDPHLAVTLRADLGNAAGAMPVSFSIGLRGDNLDGPFDYSPDLKHSVMLPFH
jgi:hypothetical protein